MQLKVFLLSVLAAVITAAPSQPKEDLSVSEGRNLPSYSPVAYAPAPKQYSSATVTSYNRRGHQATEYAKPTVYGSSYGAQPSIRSPVYSPEPNAHGYSSQALSYPGPVAAGYGSYGPQTNAYSDHSQHLSQDPAYDPAKDPVSQYADYVPAREYAPKGHTNGNELSIYGYRK